MKNLFDRKKPTIWAVVLVMIFTLTVGILRIAFDYEYAPTSVAKKELPVYCVDTQGKKQIAISFDAAWDE